LWRSSTVKAKVSQIFSIGKFLARYFLLESSSKPQGECHQTKGLMSRTMAVHVRYKSLYISLPSSAQLQRKMTMENANDS